MAKLKNPLLSLSGKGGLGKVVSFVKRGGTNIAEKKPEVPDAKTLAQLEWRHMYQKAVALWHALSAAEKQEWESLARPKHMTGFAWFVSQALKPNPGLYLPLQGGTMAGDIDMDGHKIKELPLPTQDRDAVPKKYHDDNLPPGPYTQGCRVWRATGTTVPTATYVIIPFDREDHDTDEMHDLVVNPDRITIKTEGTYLFKAHFLWPTNAVGYRRAELRKNGSATLMRHQIDGQSVNTTTSLVDTTFYCTVGQYFQVRVRQTSGGNLIIPSYTRYSPVFLAQRIG